MRPQIKQPRRDRRWVAPGGIGLFLAACFLLGALTVSRATRAPSESALAAEPPQPRQPAGLQYASKPDYRPPSFVPNKYDQEMLQHAFDGKFADHLAHDIRNEVFEDCHRELVTASHDYCQKIYEATVRVGPQIIDTKRRLLRGEIDSSTFQSLLHQHFLEREIALEQFMSWDDQLKFEGVPPGRDVFMALSNWGMDVPEGFKLGLVEPPEVTASNEAEGPPPEATLTGSPPEAEEEK